MCLFSPTRRSISIRARTDPQRNAIGHVAQHGSAAIATQVEKPHLATACPHHDASARLGHVRRLPRRMRARRAMRQWPPHVRGVRHGKRGRGGHVVRRMPRAAVHTARRPNACAVDGSVGRKASLRNLRMHASLDTLRRASRVVSGAQVPVSARRVPRVGPSMRSLRPHVRCAHDCHPPSER